MALVTMLCSNPGSFGQQAKGGAKPPAAAVPAAVPAGKAAQAVEAVDPKQQEWRQQSAQLLLLATQLKHDVDITTENILSLRVIEKAREIEKFTHAAEQQLKAAK